MILNQIQCILMVRNVILYQIQYILMVRGMILTLLYLMRAKYLTILICLLSKGFSASCKKNCWEKKLTRNVSLQGK